MSKRVEESRVRALSRAFTLALVAVCLNLGPGHVLTEERSADEEDFASKERDDGEPDSSASLFGPRFPFGTEKDPFVSLRSRRERDDEDELGDDPREPHPSYTLVRRRSVKQRPRSRKAIRGAMLRDAQDRRRSSRRSDAARRVPRDLNDEDADELGLLDDPRDFEDEEVFDEFEEEALVVELPPTAFELQLETYRDPQVDVPIRQFGYDVFLRPPPEATDTPVGDDYVLGVGDELVLSLWGSIDVDFESEIGSDGQIRIPQVGPVPLKGLTLTRAEEALKKRFNRFYQAKTYSLELRVGKMRDISVHVIGRVVTPGRHRVPSLATLLDALAAADGVTKDGTLRRIILRRPGELDRDIDLYAYLLHGDSTVDVSLSSRDVIVVPAVGPRVGIVGRVLRPAIYELDTAETSFESLRAMAGGFARLADRDTVQIESMHEGKLSVRTVHPDQARKVVELGDGDVIVVRSVNPRLEKVVYLAGNVAQPGRYAHRDGMRVSDLVDGDRLVEAGFWLERMPPNRAEPDLELPEPYMDYALIRRIDPKSRQEIRVAFHLGRAVLERDPRENQLLEPQDTVVIFPRKALQQTRSVTIGGAVNKPGEVDHFPGMKLRDLVRMSGGLLPEAQRKDAVLTRVHPDQDGARGEHVQIDLEEVLKGDGEYNLTLLPDDHLAVKTVPNYQRPFTIVIEGEVRHPGSYSVIPGQRLSDILQTAGGFTDDAYLPAAQLYRENVRKLQQERLDQSLNQLERESKLAASAFAVEASVVGKQSSAALAQAEQVRIERLIETIRSTPPKGRMVIQLRPVDELRNTEYDVELAADDRLIIPRRPEEVTVIGAVFNQTALLHSHGDTVEDYIRACGGTTDSAEMSMVFLINADGTADSAESVSSWFQWDSSGGGFTRGGLMNKRLSPGDTVVVPYDVKPRMSKLGLTATITQILFQAALATGVIVALF